MRLRIPSKHAIVHYGEHVFHSSYLAVETIIGHAPLTYLAGGMLLCILLHALIEGPSSL